MFSSPYRYNAKEVVMNKPRRRRKFVTPAWIDVALCAANVALAGFSGEYFSRGLAENHMSCSGFFVGCAFLIIAAHFGFNGVAKNIKAAR